MITLGNYLQVKTLAGSAVCEWASRWSTHDSALLKKKTKSGALDLADVGAKICKREKMRMDKSP